MALTDEGMVMPVQPLNGYGNNGGGFGFGGDFLSWILLILVLGGGWGGFGGFGMGGAMMGMGMMDGFGLYPWMNQVNQMNDGFRDQQLNATAQGIQNAVTSGFGNVQLGIAGVNQNICQTGNGVISAVTGAQNAISQQMYTNELASLNRSYAEQSANQQGFNGVQAGIADLRYTEATEGCATRNQAAQNTRDIVDAIRSGDQMIMDKLCALELDGVKNQLAQAQRENAGLLNQVNMATTRAENLANADNIVNSLYNRLSTCPVGTTPVYGNQPIFTCAQNVAGSNCGCGGFAN